MESGVLNTQSHELTLSGLKVEKGNPYKTKGTHNGTSKEEEDEQDREWKLKYWGTCGSGRGGGQERKVEKHQGCSSDDRLWLNCGSV